MNTLFILLEFLFLPLLQPANHDDKYLKLYKNSDAMSLEELSKKGDTCFNINQSDTALIYFSIICKRYNENMSPEEMKLCAEGFNKLAVIYYNNYNYTKSLELLITGMQLCEQTDNKECLVKIYNNIGNVYMAFEDHKSAMDYYEKSYKMNKTGNENLQRSAAILNNMIGINYYLKNYNKAMQFIKEAERPELQNQTILKHSILLNLGVINMDLKKYDSAIYYFRKLYNDRNRQGVNNNQICMSLYNRAKTYTYSKMPDSAEYYFIENNKMAEKFGFSDLLSDGYKNLSEIYLSKKDYKNALFYKNKYLAIHDSIFDISKFSKIKEMQFMYEMGKLDRQISVLNIEKQIKDNKIKMQQTVLSVIVIALLIILLLFIIVWIQKRKLSQSYKDLFYVNKEIVESETKSKTLINQYEKKLKQKNEELYRQSTANQEEIKEDDDFKLKYISSSLTPTYKNELAEAIIDIMENTTEFYDSEFSLEKLAELVDSKTKYVSQTINEIYEKNFNALVNEYRVKAARKLLTDPEYSNYTIEAVALILGFKSRTALNPIFKKLTGLTPSQYQQMEKTKNKKHP